MRRILIAALGLSQAACSWVFMQGAPLRVQAPEQPIECTASTDHPNTDLVLAGVGLLGATGFLLSGFQAKNGWDQFGDHAMAVMLGAPGLILGLSGATGHSTASRCREVQEAGVRCRQGDVAACRSLTPKWNPPAGWRPESAPKASVPACERNADCPRPTW